MGFNISNCEAFQLAFLDGSKQVLELAILQFSAQAGFLQFKTSER